MSSSANQPVCIGSRDARSCSAQPHEAEPGGAEQVLHRAARHDIGTERPHVELEGAECLVAVGEDDRAVLVAELRDRRHVVAMPRPERDGGAANERRPLVDRLGEALERDAAVRFRTDVDDLGTPQLLRVRDLANRGELVLTDDDAVPLAREVERRDERAHPL